MIELLHGGTIKDDDPGISLNFIEYGIVETLESILYVDKFGEEWFVPSGTVSDCFSIPRITWSLVGHPYYAKSVLPAIVHDLYCVTKKRPHKRVHKVFHEMMIDVGEKRLRRSIYYQAVRMFGPKWKKG